MMNKRGFTVDESLSNLTSSASCTEASASASASSFARTDHNFIFSASPPPLKKKRNLPGNPDPDAEVVALSPKSLLATNRFLCEICGKGFQRDQNLQLHRRGHNLPWKLKQRSSKEAIRKKVYVCPEATCVHHDPSRALGDLTGIKKHFCRKHGEKKWKCEKCAKTYAVQSDWKAHSKICGTREYRCDCGTLFSRRDSFITHRAFCDAIAMESARAANPFVPAASPLNHNGLHAHLGGGGLFWKRELHAPHHPLHSPLRSTDNIPSPWLSTPQPAVHGPIPGPAPPPIDLSPSLFSPLSDSLLLAPRDHVDPHHPNPSPNPNPNNLPPYHPTPPPFSSSSHMYSATALLQKAAQMGVTTSHHHHAPFWSFSRDTGLAVPDHDNNLSSSSFAPPHHDVMMMSGTSMASSAAVGHDVHHQGLVGVLEDGLDAMLNPRMGGGGFPDRLVMRASPPPGGADRLRRSDEGGCGGVVNDGLTRDFLGLRSFSERDFLHIAGIRDHMNAAAAAAVSTSSPQTPKNQNGTFPWQ